MGVDGPVPVRRGAGKLGWVVQIGTQVFEPLRVNDPLRLGPYRLRARLGNGGMGIVYLAFAADGRAVAVKAVRDDIADDPTYRARFAREVFAAGRVSGPHVVRIVEADLGADPPWLATAYVAGPTLAQAIRANGPLDVPDALGLAGGVALALGAIHEAGIVHRDLKPANVLIGRDGPQVIDFGIARLCGSTTLTPTGVMMGSPQYTAPEQIHGFPATSATDVFALGALTFFAATGRHAFGPGPEIAVVQRIVSEPPDLTRCPPELRSLIRACVAKKPEDRPSPREVFEACQGADVEVPAAASAAVSAAASAAASTAVAVGRELPESVLRLIDARCESLAALAREDAEVGAGPAPWPDSYRRMRDLPCVRLRGLLSAGKAVRAAAWLLLLTAGMGTALVLASASRPNTPSDLGTQAITGARGAAPHMGDAIGGGPPSAGPASAEAADGDLSPTSLAGVIWAGVVRFSRAGIGLESVPPKPVSAANAAADVEEAFPAPASELATGGGPQAGLARWSGVRPPDGQQCADLVADDGAARLQVVVGDTVCVRTDRGLIAALKIRSFPSDYSGVTASVTVWSVVTY